MMPYPSILSFFNGLFPAQDLLGSLVLFVLCLKCASQYLATSTSHLPKRRLCIFPSLQQVYETDYSSLLFIAVTNVMTKCKWGGKGSFHLLGHSASQRKDKRSNQELKAEIWRQELKQRPWRNDAYCFASSCLLSLPSCTNQAHPPKEGTSHSALGPPTLISNQQNSSQTCSQASLMGATLQMRFPLSSHVQLCVKLTGTNYDTGLLCSLHSPRHKPHSSLRQPISCHPSLPCRPVSSLLFLSNDKMQIMEYQVTHSHTELDPKAHKGLGVQLQRWPLTSPMIPKHGQQQFAPQLSQEVQDTQTN